MTRSQGVLIILMLLFVSTLMVWRETRTLTSKPKWEYHVDSVADADLIPALKIAGQRGWEMVFARRATTAYPNEAKYEMIFKRPLGF